MRLLTLTDIDDHLEFSYGHKMLGFVCDKLELEKSEAAKHLMWKLYGGDGKGAMLHKDLEMT